jgi:hypothetical protein
MAAITDTNTASTVNATLMMNPVTLSRTCLTHSFNGATSTPTAFVTRERENTRTFAAGTSAP